MSSNANLWVLDFLLEADGLDDTLIKHFHDVNASQFEELPPNTQARLMLRVLRDAPAQPTGIAEAALGALNMLKGLAEHLPEQFVPGGKDALKPSAELFVEVKTELVLKTLRGDHNGEHPKVILDTFFVPPEQGGTLDPLEQDRRKEILDGLQSTETAQQLLAKYPVERLNDTVLSFVAAARAALGPNLLKLVEKDINEERYNPYQQYQPPQPAPAPVAQAPDKTKPVRGGNPKRKRSKGAATTEDVDAAGLLAGMSQSTAGMAAGSNAEQLAQQQGEGVKPVITQEGAGMDGAQQPQQQQVLLQPPSADAQALALVGADAAQGTLKSPGQPIRRKNGRWNEQETDFLIRMVREKGKGKWKRILEEGGDIFQNRSQVDLKDKWRNLERQGRVGPHDLPPPQPMQQLAGQMQVGMPPMQQMQPQTGPDGQIIGAHMPSFDNFTPEQYAALATHYATLAGQQQMLSPDILQQQLHMQPQVPDQLQGQPLLPHQLQQALPHVLQHQQLPPPQQLQGLQPPLEPHAEPQDHRQPAAEAAPAAVDPQAQGAPKAEPEPQQAVAPPPQS